MVLWKETAFPVCRATERRWKRNVVSRVSPVIVVICLPIFYYYYYYYYYLAHQHKACRQLKIKQEMTAVGD